MSEKFTLFDYVKDDSDAQDGFTLSDHCVGAADTTIYNTEEADKEPREIDPTLDTRSMMLLLFREITKGPNEGAEHGLARNHIRSMNALYKVGITQIFERQFEITNTFVNERTQTEEDRSIGNGNISFDVKISKVRLSSPTTKLYQSSRDSPQLPGGARENISTYSCLIHADATINVSATKATGGTITQTATIKDFRIAAIPCMVKSDLCNTHGLTREQLEKLGEDPDDIGGYFIIRGMPWAVVCSENILNNEPHIHITRGHNKEICRFNYLSKPGDYFENSQEVIGRRYEDHSITINVSTRKQTKTEIPFYILFRAMGMTSDEDIVDCIVMGVHEKDNLTKTLIGIIERAYDAPVKKNYQDIRYETDPVKIIEHINYTLETPSRLNAARKDENAQRYMNKNITMIFDRYIFPHIGTEPSKRIEKLRYLGLLIHKMILTSEGILPPTNRDSYDIKSVYTAGPTLAKALKTQYNIMFVQKIRKALTNAYKKDSFSSVNPADVFRGAIHGDELEKGMMQAITSGNKQIHIKNVQQPINNRVDSQIINYKNPLYVASVAHLISTSSGATSKSSERADFLRRVHAEYTGFVDPFFSAETGDAVGINKQGACSCSFTGFRSSFMLVETISSDPEVLPWHAISPTDISRKRLATVLVNGRCLGYCPSAIAFANKYRKMRRLGRIERDTGIAYRITSREVHFRLDVGRPKRPLIIVYNNWNEYVSSRTTRKNNDGSAQDSSPVPFRQWIELTRDHLYGLANNTITLESLESQGIIEYITAAEQSNCYLAMNLHVLRENASNPLKRFTHCDIEQAIVSLLLLSAPLGNNSEPNRVCYYGNHRKGAIGQSARFMRSTAKGESFMPYVDNPIVSTFADALTTPAGQNCMVALMVYGAYNQEDSLTINQRSMELGLLKCFYSTIKSSKLEKDESFGAPDAVSAPPKRGVSYANLENGFARKGSFVKKGDAIIAKTAATNKKAMDYATQTDQTIVHTSEKPMFVFDVRPKLRDGDDQIFGRVRLINTRNFEVGDKACLTPDHEVLTSVGWIPISRVGPQYLVATRTCSGVLAWEHPLRAYHYHHRGELYSIESAGVSTAVTLDHKMLVSATRDIIAVAEATRQPAPMRPDGTTLIPARLLIRYPVATYHSGCIQDKSAQIFPRSILQVLLLGISFGRVAGRVIVFPENLQARVESVGAITNMSEFPLVIEYSQTCENLIEQVIVLPDWIWKADSASAAAILKLLYLGESQKIPAGPVLAGQIMTLALICGRSAIYDESTSMCSLASGITEVLSRDTSIIEYNGDVHCLEVPGNVFYVRRAGKPHWTGNSSRTGNKGIVGNVIPATMMPYTAQGVVPDIIGNPHSIPTRMAINQIIECVAAKLAMKFGHTVDGTMFTGFDAWQLIEKLKAAGEPLGDLTVMYNPDTGEKMDAVLFGPTFYQRIAKFIDDENYANRTGPTNAITNQPVSGRANNGAMKIGEMEKDVFMTHGSMHVFGKKFYEDSDGATIYVCRRCSHLAMMNEKHNRQICVHCDEHADIYAVPSSWVANILFKKLEGMNIDPRIDLAPLVFPAESSGPL